MSLVINCYLLKIFKSQDMNTVILTSNRLLMRPRNKKMLITNLSLLIIKRNLLSLKNPANPNNLMPRLLKPLLKLFFIVMRTELLASKVWRIMIKLMYSQKMESQLLTRPTWLTLKLNNFSLLDLNLVISQLRSIYRMPEN
jgi:hypothetical protein